MARAHESRILYSGIGRRVRARHEIRLNPLASTASSVQRGEVGTVVDEVDAWLFIDFDNSEVVVERGDVAFVI